MRIGRDAFLYLESEDGDDDFAQCSDCCFFDGEHCAVIGIRVEPSASCGFFIDGKYDGTPVKPRVTARDAGLVNEKVRCENCRYGGKTCGLYDMLNVMRPTTFSLDSKIKQKACCNAFSPKETRAAATSLRPFGRLAS